MRKIVETNKQSLSEKISRKWHPKYFDKNIRSHITTKLREKACQTHDVEGSPGAPQQSELVQHLLAARDDKTT